ncbi:sigma-70 family RNA polymerase sigma factor [Pseudoneobacillus rhizosphaerae]|uniref:RNA polymerase sigma factor 70 region 4 type 2 domain-containing protein n=1 Tax=Pseudoneobacillus rhizosphaerae TaxID=2880968 RepID=A0A9C7LAH6_9BACI|nr:sigma-70 family RNA polymerase sigma factor [Pseudoneobacillus rhizosphaerae]CAG9608037.1 hypothetical protein NEOCIP111885_01729 [Pseudoneobacillus rhizosphaerae]
MQLELEYNPSRIATVEDYRLTLKEAKKLLDCAADEDEEIIKGIISDLEYTIEWMSTGRRPGNKRGIERRAAYQNNRLFDPLIIQRYFRSEEPVFSWDQHQKEDIIHSWERDQLDCALSVLTDREKEIFLMNKGHCLQNTEIASLLGVSESNISSTIHHSEKKILNHISECLICSCR